MMQTDLAPDAAVEAAARWIASDRDPIGKAILPEIKIRFGLSTCDAIEACRLAGEIRRREHGLS